MDFLKHEKNFRLQNIFDYGFTLSQGGVRGVAPPKKLEEAAFPWKISVHVASYTIKTFFVNLFMPTLAILGLTFAYLIISQICPVGL